jgi:hypothetical protein
LIILGNIMEVYGYNDYKFGVELRLEASSAGDAG